MSLTILIGESKGGDPNSFIFMQFLAKNWQAHPLWELVPPQENPGSATVFWLHFMKVSLIAQRYGLGKSEETSVRRQILKTFYLISC